MLTIHSNFSVINLKLTSNYPLAWMFFCTLATAFPTSYHMKTVFSCWGWKLSNDACPLNLAPNSSFLMQSKWLEKKANQSICIRKEALGTRLIPTKTIWYFDTSLLAMSKCIQKNSKLLKWNLVIYEIQPLVCGKILILICELSCVQGIMHFIIQSALLNYGFPFLILVCYIRLVYCMPNF